MDERRELLYLPQRFQIRRATMCRRDIAASGQPTMTETPPSFADRPPAADALADMLRAVRLTGAIFLKARFTEPFGVLSPQRYDASVPMAHLRHISVFHYVVSGGCNLETSGGHR